MPIVAFTTIGGGLAGERVFARVVSDATPPIAVESLSFTLQWDASRVSVDPETIQPFNHYTDPLVLQPNGWRLRTRSRFTGFDDLIHDPGPVDPQPGDLGLISGTLTAELVPFDNPAAGPPMRLVPPWDLIAVIFTFVPTLRVPFLGNSTLQPWFPRLVAGEINGGTVPLTSVNRYQTGNPFAWFPAPTP